MKKSNTEALKTISIELSIIRESEQGEDEKSDLSDAICAIEETLSRCAHPERQAEDQDQQDEISKLKKENEQLRSQRDASRFSACLSRIKYKTIRDAVKAQEGRSITEEELRSQLGTSGWSEDAESFVKTVRRAGWLKD